MYAQVENVRLTRQAVVSLVLAKVAAGLTKSKGIDEVLELVFREPESGRELRRQKRTVYRWLARYREGGFDALGDKDRKSPLPSRALSETFLAFLKAQKTSDPKASIPDIILAAEILEIIKKGEVNRSTAWRAARRLNLPLMGTQAKTTSTQRRFAYAHRMQMVLCDGKHFRVGIKRKRRVVFTFLDDSTRKALVVVVGKSESKLLFLRGIYRLLLRYGRLNCMYVDNGSGFIAHDVETVCARLGIHLIHGTARYPEGRGKIERFNQTIGKDLLRTFPGDPSVCADIPSLENRLEHYIRNVYNNQEHGSLNKMSPSERWNNDALPLRPIDNVEALERHFVISKSRKISPDNVLKLDGISYDMPLGHAGKMAIVEQDFIHGTVRFQHEGRLVRLSKVNLAENAKAKRAHRVEKISETLSPARTASRIAYEKDFEPIVSATGDFVDNDS